MRAEVLWKSPRAPGYWWRAYGEPSLWRAGVVISLLLMGFGLVGIVRAIARCVAAGF